MLFLSVLQYPFMSALILSIMMIGLYHSQKMWPVNSPKDKTYRRHGKMRQNDRLCLSQQHLQLVA